MKRERWGSSLGFLSAAIGSAIGIGNVWRFNYILYENGGGAFLIPYLIALLTLGIPLLLVEIWSGLWSRTSIPLIYRKINKLLEPIGWWTLINILVINIYYTAIVGWFLFYTFHSFEVVKVSDSEKFFYNFLSTNYPSLTGALIWIFCMLILSLGVRKGLERFSMIFVSLMWILMLILLFRALISPGAFDSIYKYLSVDFSKLSNWNVWITAFGQVAFSLSIAMGIMPLFGSYLNRKKEIVPNSLATAFADTSFSLISALTIFSFLGIVGLQPTEGFALAFFTFPLAIAEMPGKEIFSFIFFLTLTIAGFTSVLTSFEALIASLNDKFRIPRKSAIVLLGLFLIFLTSLFANDLNTIKFLDKITGTISLPLIALIECLIFGWLVGSTKIRNELNKFSRIKLGIYFDISLKIISPLVLFVLFSLGLKFITPIELLIISLIIIISFFISFRKS
ncbi:MAG: sodium-dependent transporter [Candidatus Aenigmarchaeota archaeon]|nr:sodium-dependent transporter [Candidatus Aenigmarchaeota archaeon]MDW8149140.1 sodium-dependent transporter [Candidatus Aenigmarchaeota archaeon]